MKKAAVLAALLTLAGVACHSTQARQDVVDHTDWSYLGMVGDTSKDAALDLADIVTLDFSFGDGLLADAQPTKIFHLGMGWMDAVRVGLRPRAFGVWEQRQAEYGVSIFYYRDISRQAVYGTSTLFAESMSYKGFDMDHQNQTGHWLDISANAHLLLMGAEAGVSPKQTLDFGLSLIKWVVTVIPIRSAFHAIGSDSLWIDIGNDDTNAPWMDAGGNAAGEVYQGETPFYERPRTAADLVPPVPMMPESAPAKK